jgi:DNA polymerase-1
LGKEVNVIWDVPPKLSGWVAMDVELVNTDIKVLHRPQGGDFALLTIYDGKNVYVIDHETSVPEAIHNLQDCVWIFHNAKFDLTHLRRWADIPQRNKIWDTMLMDKILWSGYYDTFSLADLARRYLDVLLDKTLQDKWSDVDPKEIPPEYQEYAIKDVVTTLQVAMEQKKLVKKPHFAIWKSVDLPAMWAVMDFQGFRIDEQSWMDLSDKNKKKADEIKASLPFNPDSPKASREYLSKKGFRGLSNTQESTLETWIEKYPTTAAAALAKTCLESRKYHKRFSTYGKNFLKNNMEDDLVYKCKVIFGDYNIIGAETGRLSCSSPNMQNIPSKDTQEFRECFLARPGHKLVIADYSQQEIGIAAYISQDKNLLDIFNSGKSIYISMADIMYGAKITKADPLYKRMKSVVLGTNYGMSSYGLAKKEHISEEEAEEFLNKFGRAFPDLGQWMVRQQFVKTFTKTVLGRKTWLNPYLSQHVRNALNNPIQGSAADMIKLALIEIHKKWSYEELPFSVVAVVHDEIVLDVPEDWAEPITEFVKKCTIDAANRMCPGMNFRVDVSVGQSWADKG